MNRLYYGDNLAVLRESIKDESVDLVYLDPPFNSQATYNVLFKAPTGEQSHAQIEVFEDTWHWGESAEHAFDAVMGSGNTDAAELLRAMRSFLHENDLMAYLAMMAVRLIQLYRVLKPTGSIYLHCDPTASHYLKLLLDAIFEHRISETRSLGSAQAHTAAHAATAPFTMSYFFTAAPTITLGTISFSPTTPNTSKFFLNNETPTEDIGSAWTSRAQASGMEKLANLGAASTSLRKGDTGLIHHPFSKSLMPQIRFTGRKQKTECPD